MLTLFSRPVRRARVARASRLRVTRLETRDCPAAPVVSMTVTPISPTEAQVVGTVQDEVPQTCLVTLTGDSSELVQVYANGTFAARIPASGGAVLGVVTDSQGLTSNVQTVPLANQAPVIVEFERYMDGSSWVIHGKVSDEHPAGITVTLHSSIPELNNRTVTTNADGEFEVSFLPPPGFKGGTVSAEAVDAQGLVSETVYEWIG